MTDHENGIYVLNSERAAHDAACEYQMCGFDAPHTAVWL